MSHYCEDCRGNTSSGSPCSDGCEDCPCQDPSDPRPLDEYGEECGHKKICGCDQCECDCHADNELDVPDFDRRDNDKGDWL